MRSSAKTLFFIFFFLKLRHIYIFILVCIYKYIPLFSQRHTRTSRRVLVITPLASPLMHRAQRAETCRRGFKKKKKKKKGEGGG